MKLSSIVLAANLLALVSLQGQILNDGSNLTLSNQTNSYLGDVIIGTNGALTLLTISDNALLTNTGNGFIGFSSTAHDNEVRLVSPTARWFMGVNLFVGTNGSFNRLIINNGGFVSNRDSLIGYSGSSGNNFVLVTDPGSFWTNGGLINLGVESSANRLVISNSARVSSVAGLVGITGFGPGASNNIAMVTGAGSAWNNQGSLTIGNHGNNCRLIISNSAFVDDSFGTIGALDHSSNCEAVVTGPGSVWSNRTGVVVGSLASLARLVVTNGGAVIALGDVVLGQNTTSTNNRIVVEDGRISVTNAAGTATLNLLRGTNRFNLGNIEADQLRMANTQGFFEFSGGTLVTRGAFITNAPFVLGVSGNSTALWDVRAGVSNYFLTDLYIGSNSSLNQLMVTNGALLNNNAGILGARAGANSNLAVVAGMNSVWSNRADLNVGLSGANNQLLVTNGGLVRNNFGILGVNSGSSNNIVLVMGAGSVWTNANDLYVGRSGAGNQLLVSDGGLVRNNDGYLGINTGSRSNLAIVTGLGSLWNNAGALFLGQDDQGNRVVVTNGGTVRSSSVFIGLNSGGSDNIALVTGSGSRWTNTQNFYAGYSSARNQFIVTNGATVLNSNAYLGFFASSSNNLATVTGTGSVLFNSNSLIVGQSGPGNRLVVGNGGLVQSLISQIGNASSMNNEVVVTDPASVWSQSILELGNGASANRMLVTNGGFVNSPFSYLGFQSPSKDNEAVVTGPDSLWNCGEFQLGYSGSSNRLVITNAGVVSSSSFVILGANASSTNNRLTVAGGILKLTNSTGTAVLDVRRGTTVLNMGLIDVDILRMTNSAGSFEFNSGTLLSRGAFITNIVPFVVGATGTDPAVWHVRAGASNHILQVPLVLGQSPSFNQLLVTNGALLTSGGGFVGLNSNSKSNTVVVAGLGSTWLNSATFEIGSGSSFNSLVVSNGGFVRNTFGSLGQGGGNNVALVTGAGSMWTNSAGLGIGSLGASNQLLITDGGTVKSPSAGVGGLASSSNNLVLVTGSSALFHTDSLFFGSDSTGNQLVVSNGGRVWDSTGNIGNTSAGSNNLALVTGPGSAWTNVNLTVGGVGGGNQLIVSNGAAVRGGTTMLGSDPLGSNNVALVTDPGSEINGELYVGFFGSRNQLVVTNGALAQGSYGALGLFASSSNNLALITGSGSVWSNGVEFAVGLGGRSNQLLANRQATLLGSLGFIGENTNANFNSAVVTDAGTSWLLSSNLFVGSNGALNQLIITNGASVLNNEGTIGSGIASSNNTVLVTGSGSVWSNRVNLNVGYGGRNNQLIVSNGGFVGNIQSFIGYNNGNNLALVSGPGSLWNNLNDLNIGFIGSGNQLVVSNGAVVQDNVGLLGFLSASSNNLAVVTGSGSSWSNTFELRVGLDGSGNQVVVSNGGSVFAGNGVYLGFTPASTNNRVVVDGGSLLTTNGAATGLLEIRRGTNVLNAGLVEADILRLTNGIQSKFEINGGTLSAKSSRVSIGPPLVVGNGVSTASFILAGNGTHDFSGTLGLIVLSNATLTGNGSLVVQLQVRNGARLIPGASIGKISLSTPPSLQGTVVMEVSKSGATLTNDQLQVTGTLTYGGSLTVTNLGPTALAIGDRFPLFAASTYTGSFTNILLPALTPGLAWTNKLVFDGSIEVTPGPGFVATDLSGTNVIVSGSNGPPNAPFAVLSATNVATPLSNWVSLATNQFDASGVFFFTNPIIPGEAQRYFRIRTP